LGTWTGALASVVVRSVPPHAGTPVLYVHSLLCESKYSSFAHSCLQGYSNPAGAHRVGMLFQHHQKCCEQPTPYMPSSRNAQSKSQPSAAREQRRLAASKMSPIGHCLAIASPPTHPK